MQMEDKITRMKELINILNKASELYYQKNTIMMTDYEQPNNKCRTRNIQFLKASRTS